MDQRPIYPHTPAGYNSTPALPTTNALSSQTAIGWDNLFRGFLSLAWVQLHMETDRSTSVDDSVKAMQGQPSKMITALQDYTISIWQGSRRNEVLHEAGSHGQESLHAKMNHDITQLYSLRDSYSPVIQSYFALPLEERLRQTPRQRSRWLKLAQLATSHSSASGSRQALVSHYYAFAENSTTATGTSGTSTTPPTDLLHTATRTLQQSTIQDFLAPRAVDLS